MFDESNADDESEGTRGIQYSLVEAPEDVYILMHSNAHECLDNSGIYDVGTCVWITFGGRSSTGPRGHCAAKVIRTCARAMYVGVSFTKNMMQKKQNMWGSHVCMCVMVE